MSVEDDLLARIYALVVEGRDRSAMDLLLSAMDDAMHAKDPRRVNELLERADLDRLSLTLQLALLGFSRPIASELEERPLLADRIERRLRASDPERADRLLRAVR